MSDENSYIEEECRKAINKMIEAGLVEEITNTDTGETSYILTEAWQKIMRILGHGTN